MSAPLDLSLLHWLAACEIERRQKAGIPIPARLRSSWWALTVALSEAGQPEVRPREESETNWITADEAARRLECSTRTVRRLGARIGGRKIGAAWMFDQRAVTEHQRGRTTR